MKIIQRIALGVSACVVLIASCALLSNDTSAVSPPLPFAGHGSIGEAYVLGAAPGSRLTVVNAEGTKVGGGVVDRLGSLIVRNLHPGRRVPLRGGLGTGHARHCGLLGALHAFDPRASFYSSQHLHAGLNYVRMRDGILFAATVRLPPGKTLADGPFPTVIEYSGYAVAAPHSLDERARGQGALQRPAAAGHLDRRRLGDRPASGIRDGERPDARDRVLGRARSTSSGYRPTTTATTSSRPSARSLGCCTTRSGWSGSRTRGSPSSWWRAPTRPTSRRSRLSARPTTSTRRATRAGSTTTGSRRAGSTNASRRQAGAGGGQPWAAAEIKTGDTTCLANQVLHPEAERLESLIDPDLGRTPVALRPALAGGLGDAHHVPVFLAGALEDEQVGPQWPALITALSRRQGRVRDDDERDAHRLARARDDHEVARVPRHLRGRARAERGAGPRRCSHRLLLRPPPDGAPSVGASGHPVHDTSPTFAAAKAAFAANDPRVRVLFDNGGGSLGPGALQAAYEAGFSQWPPRGPSTSYYLAANGTLSSTRRDTGRSGVLPARTRPCGRRRTSRPRRTPGRPSRLTTGRPCQRPTASRSRRRPSRRHDDRRSGEPRSRARVDGSGHGPAGDGHRGASR